MAGGDNSHLPQGGARPPRLARAPRRAPAASRLSARAHGRARAPARRSSPSSPHGCCRRGEAGSRCRSPPIRRTPTILQLESVECGAAALAMVLAYHGRHVPLEQMRVDCGVSRDGSKASGLLRAARAHGLIGARLPQGAARAGRRCRCPRSLFVNFNHFVVLEGFRDGRAYLNDPARGRRSVDAAEFDQAFTGVVLTFERGPGFRARRRARPRWCARSRKYVDGFRPRDRPAPSSWACCSCCPGLVMPWLLGRFVDEVLVAHLRRRGVAAAGRASRSRRCARSVLLAIQAHAPHGHVRPRRARRRAALLRAGARAADGRSSRSAPRARSPRAWT